MAAKKKVVEATGKFNPFWTKDTITYFGSGSRNTEHRNVVTNAHYKCETHLPFYCLPTLDARAMGTMQYFLADTDGVKLPAWIDHRNEAKYKKFLNGLWRTGRYQQFMIAMEHKTLNSGASDLVDIVRKRWDTVIKAPINLSLPFPEYSSCTGGLNIVKNAKMGAQFGMGNIHSKTVRSSHWQHPKYLYGRYFIAHYLNLVANGIRAFQHGGSSGMSVGFVPIPLMSLMFKVEDIKLIRGYMLNNKEVPAEMLELWVDKSLDDAESLHPSPLKVAFKREIRAKMVEAGVTIKVVDNLDSIMYERMALPKFKSLKLQKEWTADVMAALMDKERETNRVATKKQLIDK